MKPENVSRIEQKIGYVFKDKKLLKVCFSHSSYTNEHGEKTTRDWNFWRRAPGRVRGGFSLSDHPRQRGKNDGKAQGARGCGAVKDGDRADGAAKVHLAGGDGQNVGEKAISSLFEAIVAGIYVDGGADAAKNFINDKLLSVTDTHDSNYKGRLQEFLQYRKLENARYELIAKSGEEHAPVFTVRVYAANVTGEGSGKRQRDAEHAAAKDALSKLERHGEKNAH